MPSRHRRGPSEDDGSAAVTGAIGIAVLLLTFLGATNLIVDEYAKGALRTAVDEAAQAGAAAGGSVPVCQAEGHQVRQNLLPGVFGGAVSLGCTLEGGTVVAFAVGYLPSFVPTIPREQVAITGVSPVDDGGGP